MYEQNDERSLFSKTIIKKLCRIFHQLFFLKEAVEITQAASLRGTECDEGRTQGIITEKLRETARNTYLFAEDSTPECNIVVRGSRGSDLSARSVRHADHVTGCEII